jgi:hypothetical protein
MDLDGDKRTSVEIHGDGDVIQIRDTPNPLVVAHELVGTVGVELVLEDDFEAPSL